MSENALSFRLVKKLMVSFLLLLVLAGVSYIFITLYLTNTYFEETTQRLNAHVANHLINEKFGSEPPFLPDGSVNKPLFGDIMHDMMAVNQGIEVYLLNKQGEVMYSVVLDHSQAGEPVTQVELGPIHQFIAANGNQFILGDDPRNVERKKIFSAAPFDIDGHQGFIYIILAGKRYEEVTGSMMGSYFIKLGTGATIAALIFTAIIGLLSIWYLTKNLREIIQTVSRFRDGDLTARIANPDKKDLAVLSTTFNNMADTIVANLDELKSVEALRRELIANVSHDLRTPLSVAQGYVETMQIKKDRLTPEENDKYLNIIQNSVEKLSDLIDQLFEYSKLEAKQIEPHKELFSISDLAHDIFEKYQQLAAAKGIAIDLVVEDKLPLVFADISLVERVIQNLMDNALKFTAHGGKVAIELRSDDKHVYVSIKDNGIGIAADKLSQIFERYKQATSSHAATNKGAGLGLAIVKKIIELHDSTIEVMSRPNEGTTFQFNLPMVAKG